MSDVSVELAEITAVKPHPNADRLEIAEVAGTTVVVQKDLFRVGQRVLYFPPDLLIPDSVSREFGVTKYLKHAVYPGDSGYSQCRVSGARLRGVPSFGFVVGSLATAIEAVKSVHRDPVSQGFLSWSEWFGAVKYVPKVRTNAGEQEADDDRFHKYTNIEHFRRVSGMFDGSFDVVVTEKIHGTNCRVGLVGGEWMAGSHKIRRKQSDSCMYWEPLKTPAVRSLIEYCSADSGGKPVVLFGEIYGSGVQDLDYGVPSGEKRFRAFDLSIDGSYASWKRLNELCLTFGLQTVPKLYEGPYYRQLVIEHVDGGSLLGLNSAKFKGREGIVIRPAYEERFDGNTRVIAKAVSADYLDRDGAVDDE